MSGGGWVKVTRGGRDPCCMKVLHLCEIRDVQRALLITNDFVL